MKGQRNGVAALDHAAARSVRSNAHRDAGITEIHEVTSEIQRLAIARNETGLR